MKRLCKRLWDKLWEKIDVLADVVVPKVGKVLLGLLYFIGAPGYGLLYLLWWLAFKLQRGRFRCHAAMEEVFGGTDGMNPFAILFCLVVGGVFWGFLIRMIVKLV